MVKFKVDYVCLCKLRITFTDTNFPTLIGKIGHYIVKCKKTEILVPLKQAYLWGNLRFNEFQAICC